MRTHHPLPHSQCSLSSGGVVLAASRVRHAEVPGADPARRALTAALALEELEQVLHGVLEVDGVIEDQHAARAEHGADLL